MAIKVIAQLREVEIGKNPGIIVSIASAILTALGATSCMGL